MPPEEASALPGGAPPPALRRGTVVALGVAIAAILVCSPFAGGNAVARIARTVASAVALALLFGERRRPAGRVSSVYRLGWIALALAGGWADSGAGSPWNEALFLSVVTGLPVRRSLAPWVESLRGARLAAACIAGIALLAAGAAWSAGPAGSDPLSVRADRALVTLVVAWVVIAAAGAAAELVRRGIRRAPIRWKLVLAFGIFAITPALLAFVYALLASWIHAGDFDAAALPRELESGSAGRRWLERLETRPAPRDGAALSAWIREDEAWLARERIGVAALEGRAGAWRLVDSLGGPDSLFVPSAAPVSDAGKPASGLALRAGRLWVTRASLWPGAGDTLALQTFESVDSTRLGAYARASRCDLLIVASPTMASGRTTLRIGGAPRGNAQRFDAAWGSIDLAGRETTATARRNAAVAESPAETTGLTVVGGGAFGGAARASDARGAFNGGATLACLVWDGSAWRDGTALTLVRTNLWETIGFGGEAHGPFTNATRFVLAFFAILFILVEIVSLVVGSRIAALITRGVAGLRRAAVAVGAGDFSARVSVPTQDEIGDLAESFNRMAAGLEEGQRAALERERLRRELELARRIQARLLPESPPALPGLDMAATNEMSLQVGGDYYDFVPTADGRTAICVADVAGKGVAAALLMSNVKAALLSSAAVDRGPVAITGRVNRLLEQSIEPGRFVTFFLAVLDPDSLRFEYVNAGHPAPMLLRADGTLERLERGGTILGIDASAAFEAGAGSLRPGDLLAMFTDGVTEAQGAGDELFGEERIEEILRRECRQPAALLLDRLVGAVREYEGTRGQSDDLTAVVVKVAAEEGART